MEGHRRLKRNIATSNPSANSETSSGIRKSNHRETLETFSGVQDHLNSVAEIVGRSALAENLRKEILQRVERITRRLSDPSLYMAVIGEFSSGKSTFINALLRDNLLKANALVTTTAATKVQHGNSLRAEVVFKDQRHKKIVIKSNTKNLSVPWLPELKARGPREVIHLVTSDETVSQHVAEVNLKHPARFLSKGIVIIDTPGTNALNREHWAITNRVIENEADAAIIIIPATVPLSNSLRSFLTGPLRHCLHRCIFVISRMDQIRAKEQEVLLKNLRERLASDVEIDGTLLACSAQVVMDEVSGEVLVPASLKHWAGEFAELEKVISRRLQRERTLSIAERVLWLLAQLFEQLEEQLKTKRAEFDSRCAILHKEIVQDLKSFTEAQRKTAKEQLKESVVAIRPKLNRLIEKMKKATTKEARAALDGVTNKNELGTTFPGSVEQSISEQHLKFRKSLKGILKEVDAATSEIRDSFDKTFKEKYHRLDALRRSTLSQTRTPSVMNSNDLEVSSYLSSSFKINKEIEDKESLRVGGAAAAGLVLGTLLFPGFGTFLGPLLLGWVADLFGPTLDARKTSIWAELSKELDTYFNEVQEEARVALDASTDNAQRYLSARIDAYITKYDAVVEGMARNQEQELKQLREQQRLTEAHLAEISRRRGTLKAQCNV